jgi:hypothetical protein
LDVLVVGMKSLGHQHTFTLYTHFFLHIPHLFLLAGSPSWLNTYGCNWSPLGWIPQYGSYDFRRVHDISCIPVPMWYTKGILSVLRTNWCIQNDTLSQTILVLFLLVFDVQSPPVPNANSKYN